MRIHPAIVAQAAATAAAMMPGRFFLGVGTGENLNEHILGDRWPSADERQEMLRRGDRGDPRALGGRAVTAIDGDYYTVENARIYTLPDGAIEVAIAAGGPEAAALAGEIGDGADQHRTGEGVGRASMPGPAATAPRYGQLTVCWAETTAKAATARARVVAERRAQGELSQELPLPSHFEQAAAMVTEDDVADAVVCGPDPVEHIEGIEAFADAGFDHVYVHQVGPDQAGCIDFYEREILSEASELMPRSTVAARV